MGKRVGKYVEAEKRLRVHFDRVSREMAALRAAIKGAKDEIARRSLAGRVTGVRRRWQSAVILELTIAALGEAKPGRTNARVWQARVFGHASASGDLAIFAEPSRSGGGRGVALDLPADEAKVAHLYQRHMVAFRQLP